MDNQLEQQSKQPPNPNTQPPNPNTQPQQSTNKQNEDHLDRFKIIKDLLIHKIKRFLKSQVTHQMAIFFFEMIFIYGAILSVALITYFLYFQSFIYFMISLTLCSLMIIVNIGVNVINHKTVSNILKFEFQSYVDDSEKAIQDQQNQQQNTQQNQTEQNLQNGCCSILDKLKVCFVSIKQSSCVSYTKLTIQYFLFSILSITLLDYFIVQYNISWQIKYIDKIIQYENENLKDFEKQLKKLNKIPKEKVKDKQEFETNFNSLNDQIMEKMENLKKLKQNKQDRQAYICYKLGFQALICFIPELFLSITWQVCNLHFVEAFPYDEYAIQITFPILVTGSIVGLYNLQFFDPNQSRFLQIFVWFLFRFFELSCKVLLIAYFIKLQFEDYIHIKILGITYLVYTLLCTFLFTYVFYTFESKYTEEYKREFLEQNHTRLIEWTYSDVIQRYIKSFFLNLYARVLYWPYKESSLFTSLSFFTTIIDEDKKQKRVEVAPKIFASLMVTYDIKNKIGMKRRTYTHIVHSLRFFELIHLCLFCVLKSILEESFNELIHPRKLDIYYFGKPYIIISLILIFCFNINAANRTLNNKQKDLIGIDE